jgi:hypothetical protein
VDYWWASICEMTQSASAIVRQSLANPDANKLWKKNFFNENFEIQKTVTFKKTCNLPSTVVWFSFARDYPFAIVILIAVVIVWHNIDKYDVFGIVVKTTDVHSYRWKHASEK